MKSFDGSINTQWRREKELEIYRDLARLERRRSHADWWTCDRSHCQDRKEREREREFGVAEVEFGRRKQCEQVRGRCRSLYRQFVALFIYLFNFGELNNKGQYGQVQNRRIRRSSYGPCLLGLHSWWAGLGSGPWAYKNVSFKFYFDLWDYLVLLLNN